MTARRRRPWFQALAASGLVALGATFAVTQFRQQRAERQTRCAKHLKAIGQAILLYRHENGGRLPDSFATLMRTQDCVPSVFVSPSDDATPARDATHFDAADPSQCSFVYVGDTTPRRDGNPTEVAVVAFDRPHVHGHDGVHVLFAAGRVEFVSFVPPGELPAWWADFEASIARGDRPITLPAGAQ